MLVGVSATGKTAAVQCLVLALELQRAARAASAACTSDEAANAQLDSEGAEPDDLDGCRGASSKAIQDSINSPVGTTRNVACICRRIFPKALRVEELYGSFDAATRDWRGGILEQAIREASEAKSCPSRQWIVLDGPVDVVRYTPANVFLRAMLFLHQVVQQLAICQSSPRRDIGAPGAATNPN